MIHFIYGGCPAVQITHLDGSTEFVAISINEKLALERVSARILAQTGAVARFVEAPRSIERCFSAEQEAAIAAARAAREELLPPARHVDLIDAIRANDDEGLRKHWGTMNVPFPVDDMENDLHETVWWTALNVAAVLQRFDMMKFLVSRGAALDGVESPNLGYTESPVFTAAALGLRASLVTLEELGASMTRRLDDDLAVPDGYANLFEAALSSGCIDTMRHCLARGASFDVRALERRMYQAYRNFDCCLRVKARLAYPMFELFLSAIAKLSPEEASFARSMLLALCVIDMKFEGDACGHMASCIPLLQSAGADLSGHFPSDFKGAHAGSTPLEVAVMCYEKTKPRLEVVASLLRCGVAVPDESFLLNVDRQYIERFTQPAYGGLFPTPPPLNSAISFLRKVRSAGGYRSYIGGLRARVAATRQLYASGRALPVVFGAGPDQSSDPSQLDFLRAPGVDAAVLEAPIHLKRTLRLSGVVQRLFSQPGDVFQAIVRFWIS
jgi:hypothetical protein